MLIYIARRLVWTVVVILVVLFVTFLVFFKLPNGDPALRFAGKSPTPESTRADPASGCTSTSRSTSEFGYFVKTLRRGRRERLARPRLLLRQLRARCRSRSPSGRRGRSG